MNTLKDALKAMRKYKGLTQDEIAVQFDVTSNYISQLETGRKTPSTKFLIKYAELIGSNIAEIIFLAKMMEDGKTELKPADETVKIYIASQL